MILHPYFACSKRAKEKAFPPLEDSGFVWSGDRQSSGVPAPSPSSEALPLSSLPRLYPSRLSASLPVALPPPPERGSASPPSPAPAAPAGRAAAVRDAACSCCFHCCC